MFVRISVSQQEVNMLQNLLDGIFKNRVTTSMAIIAVIEAIWGKDLFTPDQKQAADLLIGSLVTFLLLVSRDPRWRKSA